MSSIYPTFVCLTWLATLCYLAIILLLVPFTFGIHPSSLYFPQAFLREGTKVFIRGLASVFLFVLPVGQLLGFDWCEETK